MVTAQITLPCVGPLVNFCYFLTTPHGNGAFHSKLLEIVDTAT